MADRIPVKVNGIPEALSKLRKYQSGKKEQIKDELKIGAFKVETLAKDVVAVKTGRLKSSIAIDKSDIARLVTRVGTNVKYACIFNANTQIKLPNKSKTIGQINKDDFVISQDGLNHKVIDKFKFPTIKKPDLIEIQADWRKDRKHTLIVTEDHKILTYKNNVAFWMQTKNLKKGDLIFTPRKQAYNKNIGQKKQCLNCQEIYGRKGSNLNKKFCSMNCKNEYWYEKRNNPHIGAKRSAIAKEKMSIKHQKFLSKNPNKHPNKILAQRGYKTSYEREIENWLVEAGFNYKKQFKVNKYFIDFAIPSEKILIEADGAFWHQNQKQDIERDRQILTKLGKNWRLFHIHFADRRFSKDIHPNPLENVYYLQCNKSMNSFINLDYFKPVKILKIKKFNYNDIPLKKHGTKKNSQLYDLSIRGIHSFVANGILVSNSYVEFGTKFMAARPYLYPAFFSQENEIVKAIGRVLKKDIGLK